MSSVEDLTKIEAEIGLLCDKRADLIYSLYGVTERYFVYNNRDACVANDAWVLSAKSETDKKVLFDIASKTYYPDEWREVIRQWLQEEEMRNTVEDLPVGEEDVE